MLQREPITEQIATHLADEIVTGRLADGARIPEQPWAEKLGVSRGSLRESLLILERRHLVEIEPRRGARVVPLDADWASEIAQAWFLLLEAVVGATVQRGAPAVVRRAEAALRRMKALREIDDLRGFQDAGMALALEVSRLSGNRVYAAMMRNLVPAFRRCFQFALDRLPDEREVATTFVAELLEAYIAGDSERAVRAIRALAARETVRLRQALEAAA